MIVKDQLYGCLRRVGSVEKFEKFDELSTSVAILNKRVNLARYEVNAGQQTDRAMALILVLTCEGWRYPRFWRQVWSGCCSSLDPRLLVVGDMATFLFSECRFTCFKSFTCR